MLPTRFTNGQHTKQSTRPASASSVRPGTSRSPLPARFYPIPVPIARFGPALRPTQPEAALASRIRVDPLFRQLCRPIRHDGFLASPIAEYWPFPNTYTQQQRHTTPLEVGRTVPQSSIYHSIELSSDGTSCAN